MAANSRIIAGGAIPKGRHAECLRSQIGRLPAVHRCGIFVIGKCQEKLSRDGRCISKLSTHENGEKG